MQIWIAVKNQDACIVAVQILHSIDDDNNKLYFKIIDDFYVVVDAWRRLCVT